VQPVSPELPRTMRAWLARRYGGPDVLELGDVPLPKPGPSDLLIRVEATTVSAADRRIRTLDFPKGLRLIGRAVFGFTRPRRPVLGVELTGIVVARGERVTRFGPGDAVIAFPGVGLGAHAEYAVVAESRPIVMRPAELTVEAAAALAFGGLTARDFLRRAGLRAGERVMVIGASGTVGSALVQLAADAGARVTAVTSTGNLDLARSIGAAEVIDYTKQDLASAGDPHDIVADAVGTLTFASVQPLLAEGGRYLAINGGVPDMLARRRGSRHSIAGPSAERQDDLEALTDLAVEGRFQPLIDCVVPFEALAEAHARADTGRKRGSLVVRVSG
jgi:NADPH:quinone reductase-like Zn-dependent oxidoreductase